MAMQYLERELRRTGNPRDQALADIVSGALKVRGKDIPLPQGRNVQHVTLLSSGDAKKARHTLTDFGILLDGHLYDRGIKQTQLVKELNIHRTTLSQIIWGHTKPSTDLILEISDKLGLSEGDRQALLDAVPNRRRRPRKGNLR